MLSNGKATYPDVVEWMKNVTTDDIADALEEAGVDHLVELELQQRTVCIPLIMPATTGGTNCQFPEEEQFLVIVRRVEPEDRIKAMMLLRKMGHTMHDAKRMIDETPYHFYANEGYPTKALYYDPRGRDASNGGEYFSMGLELGFKFFVISTLSRNIEAWIETLDDEEREDVIFSLNFYVDLFSELANNY